ncbi:MAG: hypothetical protein ACXWRA_13285 [Pseudobdellovibrionaceae bacterium]
MAHIFLKRPLHWLSIYLLFMSLVGCGNVRFTASTSPNGTVTPAGTAGTTTPGNNGQLTGSDGGGGNDGSTPGSGPGSGTGPTPTPPPTGPRDVHYSKLVQPASNQVDFLLVIDDSASIIAVQQRMAASMTALAKQMNSLAIDWQMCLTVTTNMNKGGTAVNSGTHTCGPDGYCTGSYTGGSWTWGVSRPWSSDYVPPGGASQYVLKKITDETLLNTIFTNTIPKMGAGDQGTGDERGIKAAYNHFANSATGSFNTSGCYRPGSSVAVILVSDEDERSVAGDCSRVNTAMGDHEIPSCRYYEPPNNIRVLEFEDQPTNLLSEAKNIFGASSRFTFNSIIADTDACQAQLNQNISFEINGIPYYSPHYTGTVYRAASQLTKGGISSLCSSDLQLNLFSDVVVNTLSQITLECVPTNLSIQIGSSESTVSPLDPSKYSVSGAVVTFNPALVQNQWLKMDYSCTQ